MLWFVIRTDSATQFLRMLVAIKRFSLISLNFRSPLMSSFCVGFDCARFVEIRVDFLCSSFSKNVAVTKASLFRSRKTRLIHSASEKSRKCFLSDVYIYSARFYKSRCIKLFWDGERMCVGFN